VNKVCATASQSKFAHFRGTERKNSVPIQTENVDGNLLQQYKRVMELLQDAIRSSQNHDFNENELEKLVEALSEFVANAYVHQDYSVRATQTASVEIFDDRIEIKNAGKIHERVDVYNVQESIPQNPKIMSIFNMSGYVERMGMGINNARTYLKKIGLREAVFELEVDNIVKVTIFYNKPTTT
jgi:predicted HTH transcriptional regulator